MRSGSRNPSRSIQKTPPGAAGAGGSTPTQSISPGSLPSPAAPQLTEEELETLRQQRLVKNRSKHAKLSEKRKNRFERDRLAADHQLRVNAAAFLWKLYREWVGDRLTDVEVSEEEWTNDIVLSVGDCTGQDLASIVKKAVGEDYATCPQWSRGAVPSVACIALASSAVRAVRLAKSLYDGAPVGKLFSKHISVDDQRTWLKKHSRKSVVKSAVGTSKRVHLLLDNNDLSLNFSTVIVLDCYRDSKKQNILDMQGPKEELFSLMHEHMRSFLKQKKLRIVVYVPKEDSAEQAK